MSQDINVVPHVPRRRRDIFPVLSILKLHFSLQVSLLDHFHLERDTEQGEEAQGRVEAAEGSTPSALLGTGMGAQQGRSKGGQWDSHHPAWTELDSPAAGTTN